MLWIASVGLYYGLKNYGKTPAIIKEISQQLVLAPELAKEREYSPKNPLPIEPPSARRANAQGNSGLQP